MMMEHGFTDEMAVQEDLRSKQPGQTQEGWMARARAAIAGDERAEPFQFKPQVYHLIQLTPVPRPVK